jgi:hypothetical protein
LTHSPSSHKNYPRRSIRIRKQRGWLFRQAVQEKAKSKKQKAEIKNGLKFTCFSISAFCFPNFSFFFGYERPVVR